MLPDPLPTTPSMSKLEMHSMPDTFPTRLMDNGTWAEHFLGTVETPDSIKMVEVYHPSLMADLSKIGGKSHSTFLRSTK